MVHLKALLIRLNLATSSFLYLNFDKSAIYIMIAFHLYCLSYDNRLFIYIQPSII